ncbi:hypothetical protein IQ249_08065 [Lusitaniella coriacea LEGE 07157]|uniref:Uncharacterized protein n=1 Tax=Lusitaniella coriacea LEGE 07157 TaxID=945747 RepID=A0A8J7J9V1_9CYAN|nr:hypothetical protein [Lusitaniella coriacea]MBE9115845.1 hypothetical protein [Lusitaniella coriacea LEGE 07157]
MLLKTQEPRGALIGTKRAKMKKNAMSEDANAKLSKYWYIVRLDSMGRCKTQIQSEAETFFKQQFAGYLGLKTVNNRNIQRRLVDGKTQRRDGEIAETCLRCFVSNQLKDFCFSLEQKFGKTHDFTREELLPLVLVEGEDRSLISRILDTFDPERSNLSTWTVRLVKGDRAIKRFLLERGIEHISDWLLLVRVTPGGLHRILTTFERTDAEIARSLQLLEQFHQIYRTEFLRDRKPGSHQAYPKPTPDQLQRIAQRLTPSPSPEQVLHQLQNLSQLLRRDRLRQKGVALPEDESLDIPKARNRVYQQAETEDEQSGFLNEYRQQFNSCLQRAVQTTIENRVAYFIQGRNTPRRREQAIEKSEKFLTGLRLFYCQGLSMGDIASRISLKDQPRVSRLLELENLRSDIARNTLSCLKKHIFQIAQDYANPDRLRDLATQIESLLSEEISRVMETDKKEIHAVHHNFPTSQLAQNICQYLNSQQ